MEKDIDSLTHQNTPCAQKCCPKSTLASDEASVMLRRNSETPSTQCPSGLDDDDDDGEEAGFSADSCQDSELPQPLTHEDVSTNWSHWGESTILRTSAVMQLPQKASNCSGPFEKNKTSLRQVWEPHAIDNFENIKDFLASPEAVCGLGLETIVALRQKIAGAEALKSSRCVIARDELMPLAPTATGRVHQGSYFQVPRAASSLGSLRAEPSLACDWVPCHIGWSGN